MSDPESPARLIMGVVMIALAILGGVLIKNAVDLPMSAFGYLLFVFAVSYVIGLVRQPLSAVGRARSTTSDRPAVGEKA